MRPEGIRPADFKTALQIFSTKIDVWVKLTQCIPRGLRYILLHEIENNYVKYCCHYGDRREFYSTKMDYSVVRWSLVEELGIKYT